MIKKKYIILALLLAFGLSSKGNNLLQRNDEDKIEHLLKQMTLEEKIGQMNQTSPNNLPDLYKRIKKGEIGSILNVTDPDVINKIQKIAVEESRLGIPILVARDVIHGYKTIFPIPLGQAASFNPELVEKAAHVAALEASSDGIRWTFAPMIDISRDPRWGRVAESCGEDPYLTKEMGKAMIKGFQGDKLSNSSSIAACAKHFVGYGAAEGGRDYNSTYIPERLLRNVYLKPFDDAAKIHCATFMTSFNDNNGIPASGNKYLLKNILRNEWNYNGMVVTDWGATAEMVTHGFCKDGKEAAQKSINAGVDMEMVSETFFKHLKQLVKEGKVSEKKINRAVKNILRLKYKLGLFENPYIKTKQSVKYHKNHLALAKKIAEESTILLKNNGILPFKKEVKTIAVVGPMADAPYEQLGTWVFDGEENHTQTLLHALKKYYGSKVKILYEPTLTYSRDENDKDFIKAINYAKQADVTIACVGEESILSGEAHSLANINLQGKQSQLIEALSKSGTPLVTVVMAGRPLTIGDEVKVSDALLYAFHPGTMGGPAIADILFGKVNPSAKTPITFPKSVGQIPIYYAHKNTGRPAYENEMLISEIPIKAGQTSVGCRSFYLDEGTQPLFPFGYGLSYTSFKYNNLKIEKANLTHSDTISIAVDITNTGKVKGTEIAQVYIKDCVGTVTRPVKELKRFKRVTLQPNESKTITFNIPVNELKYWGINKNYSIEPGKHIVYVGTNSNCKLSDKFYIDN